MYVYAIAIFDAGHGEGTSVALLRQSLWRTAPEPSLRPPPFCCIGVVPGAAPRCVARACVEVTTHF